MSDVEREGPSLEPPTLFGRKKTASRATPTSPEPAPGKAEESEAPRAPRPVLPPLPRVADRVGPQLPRVSRRRTARGEGDVPTAEVETDLTTASDAPVEAISAESSDESSQASRPAPAADEGEDATESRPRAPGRYSALAVGLAVGLFLYGAGWAGIGTCRGIASDGCETVPSVLIFVVMGLIGVAAGAGLLNLVGVPDPASTSLFAVSFASLIAFLFLTDDLDTWPMALIVPGMGAIAFFLSWWLTTSWTEADSV